ncbi:putative glutathione-specific gamma-glutamylcyclotransferase 2 [Actinia tenebrosa]|uniref:glutathione-specific gamma-glutamylcyclotransferase n=1 Tax=Actinia tenebrosa TaxID=6105 RepID=A0A6P8I8I7_ACTTE|nr:putative glutathione-specific gamma-glutamylcyclotransferase 2 [Actinia tenebrosa]
MKVEDVSSLADSLQLEESNNVWVFGYGSLTWNPDFPYEEQHVGWVQGFVRRFWQGSTWHRGNEEKPGRVVTLVEENEGKVWGVAFKLPRDHIKNAFRKLFQREVKHGGYELHVKPFHAHENSKKNENISVFLYIATSANPLFIGHEPTETLAQQIARARGRCGLNVEYLFRLTDFMREQVPDAEDEDEHLFHVDFLVRKELGLPVAERSSWTELVDQITEHPLIMSQ